MEGFLTKAAEPVMIHEAAAGSFDWYRRYHALRPFVRKYIPISSRVLMVSCGNAVMSEDMATTAEYKAYQEQVMSNCARFAQTLMESGSELVSGGTENHLVLVNLKPKGIDGLRVEKPRLRPLINLYPNLITKEDLLTPTELAPFNNFSSQRPQATATAASLSPSLLWLLTPFRRHQPPANLTDSSVAPTATSSSYAKKSFAISSMDEDGDSSFDYMVFDSSSKLIPNGFMRSDSTVQVVVMFAYAGVETMIKSDPDMKFEADNFFEGGDTFQINECMTDGGDFLFIYHTARLGKLPLLRDITILTFILLN
ncbi:hypothetical protein L2E82_28111 [Cichorium intybus]|uniref:Uncharacterized protein n=1 Tax=Cichorium intybus TaxID=13427 RepID=A0ACB9CVB1_CICIN|nr:hypothetical protein L2E82_28111 [Cichorium intybus]